MALFTFLNYYGTLILPQIISLCNVSPDRSRKHLEFFPILRSCLWTMLWSMHIWANITHRYQIIIFLCNIGLADQGNMVQLAARFLQKRLCGLLGQHYCMHTSTYLIFCAIPILSLTYLGNTDQIDDLPMLPPNMIPACFYRPRLFSFIYIIKVVCYSANLANISWVVHILLWFIKNWFLEMPNQKCSNLANIV